MDGSDVSSLVGSLIAVLGERIVALAANVQDVPLVHGWSTGGNLPNADAIQALEVAERVVDLLSEHETPQGIRTWMIGDNPLLGEAPAIAIRTDGDAVIGAAKAYIAGAFE